MKRLLAIAAFFLSMTAAHAQLGVVGGITSSSIEGLKGGSDNITLYHVGVVSKSDLGLGFAIQPAITYQVKGADLKENPGVVSKTGYLEFGLGAQWGIDLLAFRPYVFAEPFIGSGLTGSESFAREDGFMSTETISKALNDAKNRLEYGFGFGAGLEITSHIQLSFQWFKNLGLLYNEGEFNKEPLEDLKDTYKDLKNYSGVKFSLAILF